MVIYPESLPENYIDVLRRGAPWCAISPLHTDGDEEGKKPHYHVMLGYHNPVTESSHAKIANELGQPMGEPITDKTSYHRYLVHDGYPEKKQYDYNDITYMGGISRADFEKPETAMEKANMIKEIVAITDEYEINNMKNLIKLLLNEERYDLIGYIQKNVYLVRSIL